MNKVRLGRTDLYVTKTAFGALPVQRRTVEDGAKLLRKAYESGINFFDTARAYTDSEEKIGLALSDVRENIIIATKSGAKTGEALLKDLETSLKNLKTDYIDIYQFHNPNFVPKPGGEDGLYDAALKAKAEGKIRHIGITNHSAERAKEAVLSGLYETVQYPFSLISDENEIELVNLCKEHDVGFICMKALCGGLITDIEAAFAFVYHYENAVPIFGIQKEEELLEFLELTKNPPVFDEDMAKRALKEKAALGGDFCRACGYCLPCPAQINIPTAARMKLLLGRSTYWNLVTPENRAEMEKITNCIHCNHCVNHCPYHLDTPNRLIAELEYYREFCKEFDETDGKMNRNFLIK